MDARGVEPLSYIQILSKELQAYLLYRLQTRLFSHFATDNDLIIAKLLYQESGALYCYQRSVLGQCNHYYFSLLRPTAFLRTRYGQALHLHYP